MPYAEKDELLAYETVYRQKQVNALRDAINGGERGPMDAAWAVLLALESI